MLASFRNSLNSFYVKLLMVLLALTFVLWGVGDVFRNSGSHSDNAIKIGSQVMSKQEFVNQFKNNIQVLEKQFGRPLSKEDLNNPQLKQVVLNQMVNQMIVKELSRDMGLHVSDDMVKYEIAALPTFQKDGKFDKDALDGYLRNAGLSEAMFVNMLKDEISSQNITMLFSVIRFKSDMLAETMTKARGQTRVVKLINVPKSSVKITENPKPEDLQALYEAQKAKFAIPEKRDVSYVTFGVDSIDSVADVSDETLASVYESRKAEFSEPEKRTVHQIVFKNKEQADAALAKMKGGKSFTDVAKEEFPNKSSFLLGEITKVGLSPDISTPIFAVAQGANTDVVQSPLGYHIFMVESIVPEKSKPFADVKAQIKRAYMQEKRFEKLTELAQSVDKEVLIGKSLKEIADKFGFKVEKIVQAAQGVENSNTYMKFASFNSTVFSTDEGTVSMVAPLEGQDKYFILSAEHVYPSSFKAFSEVEGDVLKMWMDQAIESKVRDTAEDAHKLLASGSSIDDVVKKFGLVAPQSMNISLYSEAAKGLSYEFLKAIYTAKMGEYTQAIRDPKSGYTIGYLSQVIDADISAMKEKQMMSLAELMQSAPNEMFAQLLELARSKYDLEINHKFIEELEF